MGFDEASTPREADGRFAEKTGAAAEVSLAALPSFLRLRAGSVISTPAGDPNSDYEFPASRFIAEEDVTAIVTYKGIEENPPHVKWHSHSTTLRHPSGRELVVDGIDPLSYVSAPSATQALGSALRSAAAWELEEKNLTAEQVASDIGMSGAEGARYLASAREHAEAVKTFVGEERYAEYMTEDVD